MAWLPRIYPKPNRHTAQIFPLLKVLACGLAKMTLLIFHPNLPTSLAPTRILPEIRLGWSPWNGTTASGQGIEVITRCSIAGFGVSTYESTPSLFRQGLAATKAYSTILLTPLVRLHRSRQLATA
jgi:hypothetical protein